MKRHTGVRKILRWSKLWGFAIVTTCLVGCGSEVAIDSGRILDIEGDAVVYSEFEAFLRRHLGSEELTFGGLVESRLLDQFINEQLVVRLARERGMTMDVAFPDAPVPDENEAVSFLLRDQRGTVISDDRLRAAYQQHIDRYQRPQEVWLCQILVDDRSIAEEAYAALTAGEPFAEVAARFSQGPKAMHGGDQGRLSQNDLPPEFIDIIFNLEAGEFSQIVIADYGVHIFQVKEAYPAETQTFDEVAGELRQELLHQQVDTVVDGFFAEARERYNVQVFPLNLPFDYRGSFSYAMQTTD